VAAVDSPSINDIAARARYHAASAFLSKSISRSHAGSWFQLGTIWDVLSPVGL